MKEEIIVVIKEGGEIHTEARGVKGKACIELTEFISALGEPTRKLKGEYFQYDKTKIAPHLIIGKKKNVPQEPA